MARAHRRTTPRRTRTAVGLVLALLLCVTTGCSWPRDTSGSLDAASGGTLRVGVSVNPPFTTMENGEVGGSESTLVRGYARSIGADVRWRIGAESVLAEEMRNGDLDVVIGGLTSTSPWTDKMALTRPYRTVTAPDGSPVKMVMGAPLGENALLVSLETYLSEHGAQG
ncbi:MAG: transporter substrate-binding domain-containing protein [Acidipropionibacterium acidipropionici]|jgi:polar amino acid transport system substrate-binding protein|uniref:Extracellular solute-binding protein, family 3 n=1 Tax=Acidipropionibacterium acidipropionici (strain ATCC 4875 / DSM 20272 / JCM 6432 / NBRC 12425 / NCIMB 8070 / 4) TaxID=1171373 RepID=K7RRP4_ACIA4|nr:transporter substrate-binding domain-containing protein [Acidipropionibacterium acidipropionici]AFV90724.1 Extracellular solute-binding protein, family 3 [Acidipropionibacterium acidipropionici ATCC 4875]ALN15109.1 ABC transporter substrate-binding protein [Acidipropionibacterium acidipropionici]APZ09137.1 ABC transporter substrate-binding protein [Acidipropionibacterium acidipropionici]